jgi:NitT/TauT family transport system substrate-binding protein
VQASKLASTPYPNIEGIKAVMTTYNYHEMARHKPEDFYEASFVAELDKSGYIASLYGKVP